MAATFDDVATPRQSVRDQVREITESTAPSRPAGVRLRGDASTPRFKRSTGPIQLPQLRVPKLALFAVFHRASAGGWVRRYWYGEQREPPAPRVR